MSVSVKMTPSDREALNRAAAVLWPGAVLTQSGIILGLARRAADSALKEKGKGRKDPPPARRA